MRRQDGWAVAVMRLFIFISTLFAAFAVAKPLDEASAYCPISPDSIVSDGACTSYSALETLNSQLRPILTSLTNETDYFGYYRLNLFEKKCSLWSDNSGMCGNRACAVDTIDNEKDVPEIWRAGELGKLKGHHHRHPGAFGVNQNLSHSDKRSFEGGCLYEHSEPTTQRDYCEKEDEDDVLHSVYVSLKDNPERYTGYEGHSAHRVWEAIYQENCFAAPSSPPSSPFNMKQAPAYQDLRSVVSGAAMKASPSSHQKLLDLNAIQQSESNSQCIERRVFHRLVSGMQASISTHICADYLDKATGTWSTNLSCYEERLHAHPERIQNIYFNYALVLRALSKLASFFTAQTFCTGDLAQNLVTKSKLLDLTSVLSHGAVGDVFDESLLFHDPELKDDFRSRFRNVSRIMDCVGCDKCRLWGKIQTQGYGTALKVLFEPGADLELQRTEIVALVNLADRLSHSIAAQEMFRDMLEEREVERAWAEHEAKLQGKEKEERPRPETPEVFAEPPLEPARTAAANFTAFIAQRYNGRNPMSSPMAGTARKPFGYLACNRAWECVWSFLRHVRRELVRVVKMLKFGS